MQVGPFSRWVIAAAVLSLAKPGYALSVYDVIQLSRQNYSDRKIVKLIEVTGSAFELRAEDIARLKDLGISEPVIQAMLKAAPPEHQPESNSAQGAGRKLAKPASSSEHHETDPDSQATSVVTAEMPSKKASVGEVFSSESLLEEATGGHRHQAVTLSGIRVLVLRDEGRYATVAIRAEAVVRRLEQARSLGAGVFRPIRVGGVDAVVFHGRNAPRDVVIVSMSARDARAYQTRSGRPVSRALLAAYWSALLSDYWSIAVLGEPPRRLVGLHEGEALRTLFSLRGASGDAPRPFKAAVQSLPRPARDHLSQLAGTVPRSFFAPHPHGAKAP